MRSFAALLLCTGCSGYIGTAQSFDPAKAPATLDWLDGIEAIRQQSENDCGPAALAMVLRWHEEAVTLDELVRTCERGAGGGVTAAALRNAARARGFHSEIVAGAIQDLRKHIAKGRPLIVGLVKPYLDGSRNHYEVAVGIDDAEKVVITIDPAKGWTWNSFDGFLEEWEPAGRPLLIIVRER